MVDATCRLSGRRRRRRRRSRSVRDMMADGGCQGLRAPSATIVAPRRVLAVGGVNGRGQPRRRKGHTRRQRRWGRAAAVYRRNGDGLSAAGGGVKRAVYARHLDLFTRRIASVLGENTDVFLIFMSLRNFEFLIGYNY